MTLQILTVKEEDIGIICVKPGGVSWRKCKCRDALPSGQHTRCGPNCPALLLRARDPKDAVRKLHAPCNCNCNCSERGPKTARRLIKTECL
ncbi:hypothetical protein CDAR_320931 [Caerostris darwini]|uniref:Uncharacterized protein n=1 Tax=Caerostris darwini TaxID=1538125 RepID=A0AAV4WX46_9ARAC|nr:hypothetical protein CDAR_320931 [Caerostris darwini]